MEIQTPGVIPPPKSGRGWKRYERLTYQEVALSCNLLDLLKDSAFRLFLHALYPTLRQRHRWQREEEEPEVYLVEQTNDEMAVLVQTDHLVVYGHDEQLAIHLKESINTFEELGHPSLEAYHIEVQEQRAMLVLGAHTFPLALLASGR